MNYAPKPNECVALLVSDDLSLEGIVRRTVGRGLGHIPILRHHARLGPALDAAWQEQVDLAVIDLRGSPEAETGLLAAFVTQIPDIPVVVIGENARSAEVETLLENRPHRRSLNDRADAEEIRREIRDVLKNKPAEDERRPRRFDPKDGLPYPAVLMDWIQQSIVAQAREGSALAILVVDSGRTEHQSSGRAGSDRDRVMGEVGRRLLQTLDPGDTISHLGGDRFAILAPTVADRGHAVLGAEGLLAALTEQFAGGAIGIAMCPDHGRYPGLLLGRAEAAAADARRLNSGYSIYASNAEPEPDSRTVLASEPRDAIENGGLVLHYQPLSDLRTGQTVGVEALVRWRHPSHGLLGPDEFVPMAERTGLVLGLTLRVLDDAVRQCAEWHAAGQAVMVTVNLSPQTIHVIDLPEIVQQTLTRYGLPPSGLALEITEHALITDLRGAVDVLQEIAATGVRIISDDFGIGYSSLALLRRLPVAAIKIDLSFVRRIAEDDRDAARVMSIIDLGHNLGLEVIAEGVESEAIWKLLAAHGCDTAQGFYVDRPVPAEGINLAKVAAGAGNGAMGRHRRGAKAGLRARASLPQQFWRVDG